jgi:hypothetical protein
VESYVFIIGCGRSGSTILGNVLDRHPDVAHWMEPYFIWDYHLGNLEDDLRAEEYATESVVNFIQKEGNIFARKSNARIIIDKYPPNSFRIPFLLKVYPNAKWIHLIRDGRDVAVSLRREWEKRNRLVSSRSILEYKNQIWSVLKRQPFWRNRFQMLWYEIKNTKSWKNQEYCNKAKWNGPQGYGARFKNWEEAFRGKSLIEIGALQWLNSEEAVQKGLIDVSEENKLKVYYEKLIQHSENEISRILDFLGADSSLAQNIRCDFYPDNFGKWKTKLNDFEKKLISPIVDGMLRQLGYKPDTI